MMHSMSAEYKAVLALCKGWSTGLSTMAVSNEGSVYCSATFGA